MGVLHVYENQPVHAQHTWQASTQSADGILDDLTTAAEATAASAQPGAQPRWSMCLHHCNTCQLSMCIILHIWPGSFGRGAAPAEGGWPFSNDLPHINAFGFERNSVRVKPPWMLVGKARPAFASIQSLCGQRHQPTSLLALTPQPRSVFRHPQAAATHIGCVSNSKSASGCTM